MPDVARNILAQDDVMETVTNVPVAAARAGDAVAVVGHTVGDAARTGEVLSVRRSGDTVGLRVRWEDGHLSILFPGPDVVIHRHNHGPPRRV
jgi:hypothetical protein